MSGNQGPLINQPFRAEAVQRWQPGQRQPGDKEHREGQWHPSADTAEVVERCDMRLCQNGTGSQEQRVLQQRVVEGMGQAAGRGKRIAQGQRAHHVAQLRDGRIDQQALDPGLDDRHQPGVERGDGAQQGQPVADRIQPEDGPDPLLSSTAEM